MKLGFTLLFTAIALTLVLILVIRFFPSRTLVLLAFAGYLIALFYAVAVKGRTPGTQGVNFHLPLPFLEALMRGSYDRFTNRSLLNMVVFIPFGFLLPLVISALRPEIKITWIQAVLIGFCFSLFIESCQYLVQIGEFELDDLVKNTMGTAIGAYIALWLFPEGLPR